MNSSPKQETRRAPLASVVVLAAAVGCGSSNAEVGPPDGGAPASRGGSGAPSGAAGSSGTAGGNAGSGGSGVGACPARTTITLAQRMVLDASWTGSTATAAGTGKVYLWNLAKLNASGAALTGETRSCGTALPEFMLTAAGQLVTGGTKVSVEVPFGVWDTPSIPKFEAKGTVGGWQPGNAFSIDGTVALVGVTLPDPRGAWPMSYTALTTLDADGDGKPGVTAVPRSGAGYVLPPTGLGLLGSAPQADRVYLVSRSIIALSGMFTSCTEIAGSTQVMFFDNHVVGCRLMSGQDCSAGQTDFLDQGRTAYQISAGTFTIAIAPEDTTCADVRTMLPM